MIIMDIRPYASGKAMSEEICLRQIDADSLTDTQIALNRLMVLC
jgi:hypothetical protein